MGGDIARLYTILAEAFFEDIGCEEFKKLFEGMNAANNHDVGKEKVHSERP